jgi:hypothetical protein
MTIPWGTLARQSAKLVVWLAARAGHSPRDLVTEAAGEGVRELERRRHPSDPPPAPPMTPR